MMNPFYNYTTYLFHFNSSFNGTLLFYLLPILLLLNKDFKIPNKQYRSAVTRLSVLSRYHTYIDETATQSDVCLYPVNNAFDVGNW